MNTSRIDAVTRTRPRSRTRLMLAAATPLLLVVTAACSSASQPGTQDNSAGATRTADRPFTILNSYEVTDIDPVKSGAAWLWDFGASETLVERADDGSLKGLLATSWERTGDKEWTFALRPGVTFQNGTPVTAEAVATAFTRQLATLESAKKALPGGRVQARGADRVVVSTATPNAFVPDAMAERAPFAVYDAAAVTKAGGANAALLDTGYLTGPYAVSGFDPETLTLKRYDGYWGGKPPLPGVVVKRVLNEQSRILAVQSGEADLALYPPIEAKRTLQGRKDSYFKTSSKAIQGVTMDLNLTRAPFDDAEVRKAFAKAIDYDAIANQILDGVFGVADSLYPSEFVGYAVKNQTTDTKESARLLDAAGWVRGSDGVRTKDGKPLTVKLLRAAQDPETASIAVGLQEQLAGQGWRLEIVSSEDFMTVQQDLSAWNTTTYLTGLLSTSGNPLPPIQNKLVTGGANNIGQISDPQLDKIAAELPLAAEPSRREALLKRTQEIVGGEKTYLIVSSFKRFAAVSGANYPNYTVSNFRRHVTPQTAPGQ